jgi:RND family efflux transporter MFP subunit
MKRLFISILFAFLISSSLLGQKSESDFDEHVFDFEKDLTQIPENQGYLVILEPYRRTLLFAEVNSPVIKITKRMGDSFKEGEVLINLEDVVFKSNYEKAKALLAKHQAAVLAKKQLYEDKIASLFELREAEADVATSKADVSLAKKNLRSSVIRAPFDGKVVELAVEEHELPRPGKELIELVDDHILLARFLVPSSELGKISIDQPVYITLNTNNENIVAKIARIGAVIDPSSSLIKVESEIDNRDGRLKSGMTGTAYFTSPEERAKILTPPPPPMPLAPEEKLNTPLLEEQPAPNKNQKEMNP